MSEKNFDLSIILDTNEAQNQLKDIEQKTKDVDGEIEKVKKKEKETRVAIISMVRATYGMLKGLISIGGFTINRMVDALIQSSLMVGQQMYVIAGAEAITPGMQAAAYITAIQAAIVIGSAYGAMREGENLGREIEATNMIIGNINAMVGMYHFES